MKAISNIYIYIFINMEFSIDICALRYSQRDQSGLQENTDLKMKQKMKKSLLDKPANAYILHRDIRSHSIVRDEK